MPCKGTGYQNFSRESKYKHSASIQTLSRSVRRAVAHMHGMRADPLFCLYEASQLSSYSLFTRSYSASKKTAFSEDYYFAFFAVSSMQPAAWPCMAGSFVHGILLPKQQPVFLSFLRKCILRSDLERLRRTYIRTSHDREIGPDLLCTQTVINPLFYVKITKGKKASVPYWLEGLPNMHKNATRSLTLSQTGDACLSFFFR